MPASTPTTKDEVLLTDGTLIHSRPNWPCVICRPGDPVGAPVAMLCVDCAAELVERALSNPRRRSEWTDLIGLLALVREPHHSL
jgi:hypothetical protein